MRTLTDLHKNEVNDRLEMGRVTVTATSKLTGQHITLRLRCKNRNLKKRYVTFDEAIIVVADVPNRSTGANDMVGYILVKGSDNVPRSNRHADVARFWLFQQVWNYCLTGLLNSNLDLKVEDYCGHCGRPMTDPVSIERGFGPECFGKRTGSHHQHRAPKPETDVQMRLISV